MSTAVLISIRPKWCALIASGQKTIEVRKTAPKLSTPFKCYIYQTLPKSGDWNERDGRVIGEFICRNIRPVVAGYIHGACLTCDEVTNYLGRNGRGWGLEISDLKIYDQPIPLEDFYHWCGWSFFSVERPPQSWMYVEEL